MNAKPSLAAIFHPPSGASGPEQLVAKARRATACDLVTSLAEFDLETVILTPESEAVTFAPSVQLHRTAEDGPFHFGESLKQLIRERRPNGLLVFGSGSGGLLSARHLGSLCRFVQRPSPSAVFNSFYSCDFAAIAKAEGLLDLELPQTDNALGFALADAGWLCHTMTRAADTQFDIDTPADAHILAKSGRGGGHTRTFLDRMAVPHPTLGAVLERLADRSAVVSLIGRLSPKTWSDVESQFACRTSALVEGRGMRSHGLRGSPVLRQALRDEGPRAFFRRLAESADAAIVDSRPLLIDAASPMPPASDRFACDLLEVSDIADPHWAEFAAEAADAAIPILLGGHSIVSGGLYLMAEACWNGRDMERRLHPDLFEPDKEPS